MKNISLVGAGYWGSKLIKQLETIDGVGDVEIIDIKDGKNLSDIKYENVVLATPAWDHYKQTMELLELGKNLYVEKPLALTTQECLDIKGKIRNNQILMVGHIFLYNDRVKKIKDLLPRIGKILHVESNRLNWGRYQKKISTLHSLAPHDVSVIHYLLGYHEFKDIINIGDNLTNNSQNDRDEYSFICDNISVKLNLSWYYPEKVRTMSITGEKGLLFWDEEARTIKLTTDIWQDGRMNYEPTVETFDIDSNPLRNELKEFVECITTKRKPLTDVNNAINVAKNLDLLFNSIS
jgi:predicted dehydrogenase